MLILTRKSGESIRIGNSIVVHILDSNSNQMKVGISAPREIPVYRNEVYEKIEIENRAATIGLAQHDSLLSGLKQIKSKREQSGDEAQE
jgi:carbon storage regulator